MSDENQTDGGGVQATSGRESGASETTTTTTHDGETSTTADESGPSEAESSSAMLGVEGAIATADDFRHSRDEQGDLLPVPERVPGETRPCAECAGTGTDYPADREAVHLDEDDLVCANCGGDGEVDVYVLVRPITQGEAEKYLPQSGNVDALDDDGMLRIVREFVVEPDFSDVDSLDEFYAFGLDPLLMAVMNASGFRMTQGVIAENSGLMDVVEGNSRGGS